MCVCECACVYIANLDEQQLSVPANVFESSRHRNHGAGTRHDFPSLYPSLTIHTALFSCPKRTDLPHTPPPHSQYIQPHSRKFLCLTSCCLCLWRRPAHLATARSTRICYLWRRPVHLATAHAICVATATANAYLLSLATACAPGDGPRNLCGDHDRDRVSFIFGDGQHTWRRPAQCVNFRYYKTG